MLPPAIQNIRTMFLVALRSVCKPAVTGPFDSKALWLVMYITAVHVRAQVPPPPPPPPPPPRALAGSEPPSLFLPQKPIHFDVASIKVNERGGGQFAIGPRTVVLSDMTMERLIYLAYGIKPDQVALNHVKLGSKRYDIRAQAGQPATRDQMMLMLRSLLVERFHLVAHPEHRMLSSYVLSADKPGTKLRTASVTSPVALTESEINAAVSATEVRITGKGASLRQLTEWLSAYLSSNIVDSTALRGSYNFSITWPNAPADSDQNARDIAAIIAAFREQAGLVLKSRRVSTEVLIIDSVSPPTAN